MIKLENIGILQGNFELRALNLHLPAGCYCMLMGASGSGKTTLLEIICGLRKATSGTLFINGREVTSLKPADRGIGYVPQDGALFSTMSVYEHLAFALRLRRWSQQRIDARVRELASWLSIEHLLRRTPQGLSGGEVQRVALGRAMAFSPSVLCLDEPLSALDDTARHEMHALLRKVRELSQATVLHVTHHGGDAAQLADRIYVIEGGLIRQQ